MNELCQSIVYLIVCLLILTTDTNPKPNKQEYYTQCGNLINKTKGIIQTPGFPKRFLVPIKCRWVIDASAHPDKNIVIYLTQLYVTAGLKFTDYVYYENDSGMKYSESVGHIVTPENVTSSPWIRSFAPYLMIEFELDRLEGNHLRFLDDKHNVYFMYGFNITFELIQRSSKVRESCNARICSLLGECYASADFSSYECSCFQGFSGANCAQGPLCEGHTCKNGGTCVHSSAVSFGCKCTKGFAGSKCEFPLKLACDGEDCNETQCFFDGVSEPSCDCDDPRNISRGRARYEGTVYFSNFTSKSGFKFAESKNRSFETHLEKMINKYLKNISNIDNFKILNYNVGANVTFHFFGPKNEDDNIRGVLKRLIEKEGATLTASNVTLQQDPTLLIENTGLENCQYIVYIRENCGNPFGAENKSVFCHGVSVVVSKKSIRVGQEFSISCVAQGSVYMTFTWFKDGASINESVITRSVSMHLIYLSRGRYQYTLLIDKASSLDEGIYTCHVSDWHVQQCKGIHVDIASPPEIRLTPMSVTVEKGANLDLVCIPLNNRPKQEKFGYSWIKNRHLLKMTPEREVWEDLYLSHYNGVVNTGSVLEVTNIQKSATYTCQAQGIGASSELSVHVEVVNKSVVPLCLTEGKYGVAWQATAPGLKTVADCPFHEGGHATRECRLTDVNTTHWELPNFTGCLSSEIELIYKNFTKLTLGYEVTNGSITISNLLKEVSKRSLFLPGECERITDILDEVLKYLNGSALFNDFQNSAIPFYNLINLLLGHEYCFITEKKIVQLQNLVKLKGIVWGSLFAEPSSVFIDMNSLAVEVKKLSKKGTHNLSFPPKNRPHSSWLNDRISIRMNSFKAKESLGNVTVVVAVYKNLTRFLRTRYLTKFDDGTDLEYEINSRLVTVELGRQRYRIEPPEETFLVEIELEHFVTDYSSSLWKWTCGVTESASFKDTWDLNSCSSHLLFGNVTKCRCKKTGTYAALLVSKSYSTTINSKENKHFIVVIGCGCCLVQSLLTLCLLLPYWCRRKTCLVFLKMQCCLATACAMSVFIYSVQHSLSKTVFPLVTTFLEIFLLVGLSSHLSKLLVVYTEIIQFPHHNRMKETVVCIITGVPVLTVLCNFLGYHSTGWNLHSWWIIKGSMIFNVFITSASVLVILFVFLYISVVRKLRVLSQKCNDKNKTVFRRIGLLNRGCIIFSTMVLMESASIFYINVLDVSSQYFFSSSSALLGFVILFCYILKSECSFQDKLMKSLKASVTDDDFSSESIISPLKFFTKQEGDDGSEEAALPKPTAGTAKTYNQVRSSNQNSRNRCEHITLSEPFSKRKDEGGTSTLETFVGSIDGSVEDRIQGQLSLTPTMFKPLTSFKFQEQDFGEYVEQDQPPVLEDQSWKFTKSNGVLPKPNAAQCYIRETPVASQEIITTRVCVELGLITPHQKNATTGQETPTPAIVLCSFDVEPCQSRVVEMTDVVSDSICCNGVSNPGSFILGISGQESDGIVCSNPEVKEASPDASRLEEESTTSEKTDSSSLPEYEEKKRQAEPEPKKVTAQNSEDNIDGMLDRISHDLDYLLNRRPAFPLRKTSKPPSSLIRGKICEEDEADANSEFLS